ncbi:hypothetical protein BV898_09813 [Hypsibius exemplaris]|uniref:Uncharacterized protein n=1 Tax=Hypsibius exemplaris TaxID=2072580 RepID=A0A1W0WLP5_HYPEX|nr:hypothetical protein BV898_09813 [Hypsibius exemplaris]
MTTALVLPYRDVSRIRFRGVLLAAGGLVILLGLAVLSLEIAAYFLNARADHTLQVPSTVNLLQILSATAAFFAVVAGLFSVISARGAATEAKTTKRSFLLSAIFSAVAAIALIVAVSLILPSAMGWWSHPTLTDTVLPAATAITQSPLLFHQNGEPINDRDDQTLAAQSDKRIAETLNFVSLVLEGVLVLGTLTCLVISVINHRQKAGPFDETVKYHLAPRASTAYQDPRVDRMITDL